MVSPRLHHWLFAPLLLLIGAGCSNPLSSSQSDSIQNFHSKNVSCDEIDFSDSTFTVDLVRQLTHCLNSDQQINALDNLMASMPDSDLQPVADFANEIISTQPKYLFALKETYDRAKSTGDLSALEQTISNLLADSGRNAALIAVLKKISTPLTSFVFDPNLHGSLTNLYIILRSAAFQRFGTENLGNRNLSQLLIAVNHYLKASDAVPAATLYGFIANHSLDVRWTNMISSSEQTHVQNVAHFFEWLVQNGHYSVLSNSVHAMITEPVVCFGSHTVPNSLISTTNLLVNMSAAQAKTYLTHDLKNLYLASESYCQYPYASSAAIALVDQAVQVPGFDEVFELIKPMLADQNFISFLGSNASVQFMNSMAQFTNTHFFEDLFTVVTLHLQNSITSDGTKVAAFIDASFSPLTDADINSLLAFVAPILTPNEAYGEKFTKTLYQMGYGLPALAPVLSDTMRTGMITTVRDLIWRPEISPVLDLGEKLLNEGKFDGLVDQMLTYLDSVFERGAFPYQPGAPTDPTNASLPSAIYLLNQLAMTPPPVSACEDINYDWVFSQYSSAGSAAYLQQINAIQTCIDPNQTFAAAKDLITYSIAQSNYAYFMSEQQKVIDTFFTTDTPLSFSTLYDFLAINQADSATIGQTLTLTSSAFDLIKDNYLAKSNLRKALADMLKNPLPYQATSELTGPIPNRLRSSDPSLDLKNLKTITAMVDANTTLNQVPIAEALSAILKQYCPSLDIKNADCAIDSDQVTLYLQSPALLYQQIANEELTPAQSFMHPVLSTGWVHQSKSPSEVSMLEFHLNPTLHLIRQQPQAPQAILTAVSRGNNDGISLNTFINDRASRVMMIPYVYAIPNFPGQSAREYHDHIRIRVLNDLDRLELVAINADFKAFGVISNIGMGFLKEVALAWGDVPLANRPASLSKFMKPQDALTLSQVEKSIESDMAKYEGLLHDSLGSCGGHNPISWILSGPCNQLSDVRARLFNLKFLISLLKAELPEADGGYGGLVFLRDLFYSLYEADTDAQRGQYADGVKVGDNCLENPLAFSAPQAACQKDLLTVVSRVARLGLLHEAGVTTLQAKDNPIPQVTSIINDVATNSDLSGQFISSISSDAGVQMITDADNFGFQSPTGTAKNLSALAEIASLPKDLSWIHLGFELIPQDQNFISQNQALLNTLLSINSDALKPWIDQWLANSSLPTPQFLTLASQELTPAVRADVLTLLVELAPNSANFAGDISSAKNLPALSTSALSQDANLWATRFADPKLMQTRADFSNWTLTADFAQFCDVFSDSTYVSKAYNFLESINQNPNSKSFIQDCQDFLATH